MFAQVAGDDGERAVRSLGGVAGWALSGFRCVSGRDGLVEQVVGEGLCSGEARGVEQVVGCADGGVGRVR